MLMFNTRVRDAKYCVSTLILKMKRRIKFNTTWEEDEEEQRRFFAGLSYSERLRYYFKLRNMTNFHKDSYPKGKIFKISHSHDAV
jgi:hypothetical protein